LISFPALTADLYALDPFGDGFSPRSRLARMLAHKPGWFLRTSCTIFSHSI